MNNVTLLRLVISTSFLAVIILSCLSLFVLSPAYKRLIIKNTELEAIKIARHLQEMLLVEQNRSRISPGPGFEQQVDRAVKDFGLMKLKLFAADGETIFSTGAKEIGTFNRHDYFHLQVSRGEVYTKIVRKDEKSLEGQAVTADVVETYVPIMAEARFLGAFEIYLEITDNLKALQSLLYRSNGLMLLVAAGLLLALLVISRKAMLNFRSHEQAQRKIIEQSEELQTKNHELSVINEISQTLSTSIDLSHLLPNILETVIDRLAVLRLVRKGGILLINGERLELVAHLGHPDAFLTKHENLTVNDCLCGLAARTGEVIYSANSHEDAHHTICYHGMEPHGHIIIPLLSGKKVLGVLYLYLPAGTVVDESNRELLLSIGNQIGLAVDNARLYEETKRLSLHDPLTGLANRRGMEINLKHAIDLAERYRHPLTIAMLDIDFFKEYNDTHGHAAGDELLTRLARRIASSIRTSEQAVRYGGEEFLLIMPETGLDGAKAATERIRQEIGNELEITVSIGLAQFQPGSSQDELVKAADTALYLAKQKGRNRVEYEPPAE
jgi:diguanylate cyclase (GGDEF)-like protein